MTARRRRSVINPTGLARHLIVSKIRERWVLCVLVPGNKVFITEYVRYSKLRVFIYQILFILADPRLLPADIYPLSFITQHAFVERTYYM